MRMKKLTPRAADLRKLLTAIAFLSVWGISSFAQTCDNVTDGGIITGNETGCANPVFDPSPILNVILPSGGSREIEFMWMYSEGTPSANLSDWIGIPNSNTPNFDPGPITITTYFIRCTRRAGCTDYVRESNYVEKKVFCCPNLDNGGNIGYDQEHCGSSFDPAALVSLSPASGGEGAPAYQWYLSATGSPFAFGNPDWTLIEAATEAGFDPGILTQTTYFIRTAGIPGCGGYNVFSNVVKIGLYEGPDADISIENDISCSNANDGSLLVHVSGGAAPYSYQWSAPGGSTAVLNNLGAGVYTVTVTDANGCRSITSATLTAPAPLDLTVNTTSPSCYNTQDGAISYSVSGGTPPYSVTVQNGSGNVVENLNNLPAGNYTVKVSDANGCKIERSVTISAPDRLILDLESTNAGCNGAAEGTATATVTGGTPSYTYEWSNGASTASIDNLAPGTYSVTVTDAHKCEIEGSVVITALPGLTIKVVGNPPTCHGDRDGSALAIVSGGTAPFTFKWDDPAGQTTALAENLAGGTYHVTVTDANGCTGTGTVDLHEPAAITATMINTPQSCNGLGSATVVVSGGLMPYTYLWNDPAAQTTATASGLTAGTYSVTITDLNGCTLIKEVTVSRIADLQVNATATNADCSSGNTGSVTATASGGQAPYSYKWNDLAGSTTATVNNLPAGTYTVTVTDAGGCTGTASTTVTQPNPLLVNLEVFNVLCYRANSGQLNALVSGGTPPYQYAWSHPGASNDPELPGIPAGTYGLTVTDSKGCSATATATITQPDPMGLMLEAFDITCRGANNGRIMAMPVGGTAPFTYTWSIPGAVGPELINLPSDVYFVTVTDANGCQASGAAAIEEGSSLSLETGVAHVDCTNGVLGAIAVAVIGGNPPFQYHWSDPGLPAQGNQSNLQPGTYHLTVTDENNCSVSETFVIERIGSITIQLADQSICFGGSVSLGLVGAQAGWSYQWSTNGGNLSSSTSPNPTFTAATPGNYTVTVTVTNSLGCTGTSSAVISVGGDLVCQAEVLSDFDGLDISRWNGNDGSAGVNVSGGSGNYSYRWSNGATTATINNLSAGTYSVTVTDRSGCSCSSTVVLHDPAKLGDFVWNDANKNGIQDPGESGISSVMVMLEGRTTDGRDINRNMLTDADGMYMFDGLYPGSYRVTFPRPGGYDPTAQDAGLNEAKDSDAHPLTGVTAYVDLDYGMYYPDLDAGFIQQLPRIGDFVWDDHNRNGIQDAGEAGIPGIYVKLMQAGNDNVFGTPDDHTEKAMYTGPNGLYLFTEVTPGKYQIEFVLSSIPSDYAVSPKDAGANDTKDSDADPATGRTATFMVMGGQADDLTFDAGIYSLCDNVTDGGSISGDETLCGGGDAGMIVNVTLPSGGSGQLQYVWLRSRVSVYNGLGDPNWTEIPNSNSSSYDPGFLSETTYFIRCSRRENCPTYPGESNIVVKRVVPLPLTSIITAPSGTVCTSTPVNFEADIAGANATYAWNFGSGANPSVANGRTPTGIFWTTSGPKLVTLTVTREGCTDQTQITVNVSNCTVPPMLISGLKVSTTAEHQVAIHWVAEGGMEGGQFVVERSDSPTASFRTLQLVSDQGGLPQRQYQVIDENPVRGLNIYRVKHFDRKGQFSYSEQQQIWMESQDRQLIDLYPNPVADELTIRTTKELESDLTLTISDSYGHVLGEFIIPMGTYKKQLDLNNYPAGIYTVTVFQNGVRKQAYSIVKVLDR